MKVFRTSFYVPASVERNSYVRFGRDVAATSFLRPRRIRTSGKLLYGPKVRRPLNVRGRLAEWGQTLAIGGQVTFTNANQSTMRRHSCNQLLMTSLWRQKCLYQKCQAFLLFFKLFIGRSQFQGQAVTII